MPTIVGRLTGIAFQTELLVMNLLGLVNSLRRWELSWTSQVEAIRANKKLNEITKFILSWVVIVRIFIANIYTITYLANFYPILTWCRGRLLFPWMILSAVDNFILELILLITILFFWLDKSISGALVIEYIIARTIPRVPAVYYWCVINIFCTKLRENERRKKALAKFLERQELLRASFVVEHIRGNGLSDGKSSIEQYPRSASLPNLAEFSLYSSFDFEDEQEKRTKSLVTFRSFDSLEFVEPDESRVSDLEIFDDETLTPTEKAMRILDLTDEDINEARKSFEKEVSPGRTNSEKIDKIIADLTSTKLDRNISSIGPYDLSTFRTRIALANRTPRMSNPVMIEEKNLTETKRRSEKNSSPSYTLSNDKVLNLRNNEPSDSRDKKKLEAPREQKMYFKNPLSTCICERGKDEESESSGTSILDSNLGSFLVENRDDEEQDSNVAIVEMNRSSESSRNETRLLETSTYFKDINSIKKKVGKKAKISKKLSTIAVPKIFNSLQACSDSMLIQLLIHTFLTEEKSKQKNDSAYLEYLENRNHQFLYRVDGVVFQTRENTNESIENISNEDTEVIPTELNYSEHSSNSLANVETIPREFSTNTSEVSREKINFLKSNPESEKVEEERTIKKASPQCLIKKYSNVQNFLSRVKKPNGRPSKMRRRVERPESREALEMRALKMYNRLTLLEDKREMEMKKRRSSIASPISLQAFSIPKPSNSHIRSRPRDVMPKLDGFDAHLRALENSISLAFSAGNKHRYKPDNLSTDTENIGEMLKYGKPEKFQNSQYASEQTGRRIDCLYRNTDLEKTCKDERIIFDDATSLRSPFLENNDFLGKKSSSKEGELPINETAEVKNNRNEINLEKRYDISSIREALLNTDWRFRESHSSENDLWSSVERSEWTGENFLQDIVDDTDTVTLLQSAFVSNSENAIQGFHLGPGSSELYSFSDYLTRIVEEMVKTVMFTYVNETFRNQSSNELDYGDEYLREFELTGGEISRVSSGETLTESETKIKQPTVLDRSNHLLGSSAVEMCWNSYSSEGFETSRIDARDPRSNNRQIDNATENKEVRNKGSKRSIDVENDRKKVESEKNREEKCIVDILSEQERSHLEFWMRELLSSGHQRDNYEVDRHIRHLTMLPGFCVMKTVMNLFRDCVTRSTMTSRQFCGTGSETETSSLEEIPTESTSQLSNLSSDPRTLPILNEDITNPQGFYFGRPRWESATAGHALTLILNSENRWTNIEANDEIAEQEMTLRDKHDYPVIVQPAADSEATNLPDDLKVASITENSPGAFDCNDQNLHEPSKIHPTFDSYDSLCSTPGNSSHSDNVISVGTSNSLDEFSSDAPH